MWLEFMKRKFLQKGATGVPKYVLHLILDKDLALFWNLTPFLSILISPKNSPVCNKSVTTKSTK